MTQLINPQKFTETVGLLRSFFLDKGFLEVHTQNRLSILAACEDPFNESTYKNFLDSKENIGSLEGVYTIKSTKDERNYKVLETNYPKRKQH